MPKPPTPTSISVPASRVEPASKTLIVPFPPATSPSRATPPASTRPPAVMSITAPPARPTTSVAGNIEQARCTRHVRRRVRSRIKALNVDICSDRATILHIKCCRAKATDDSESGRDELGVGTVDADLAELIGLIGDKHVARVGECAAIGDAEEAPLVTCRIVQVADEHVVGREDP